MVPIAVDFLVSPAGLFVILDSAQADCRLSLTLHRAAGILTVKMVVIGAAELLATAEAVTA